MGLLGLNFGKTSSKSSLKFDKTDTSNQSQTTNTAGTTNTSTSTNNSSQGSSTSTQNGSQTTTGSKQTTGTGTTSLFGQNILGALESSVLGLLPNAGAPGMVSSGFDAESFVNDTMKSAQSQAQFGLDSQLAGITGMVGAGTENSSMGTLLANRATNDTIASLAGARGGAEKAAADIVQGINATNLAASGQNNDVLAQILGALKGGVQTSTQTGGETSTGSAQTSNTGTTNTSESSKSEQNAMQTISQLVSALLSGTTTSVGTQSGKNSGTTFGANASLGK